MSNTEMPPVLVAGAGPTGLILALTLLKNGINVRIIQKDDQFHISQRGAGIQPRTLEIYRFLGVLSDVLQQATLMPKMAMYAAGNLEPTKTFAMLPHMDPTPSVPDPNPRLLGQASAEAILRTHLENYGCQVELSTELSSFEQHEDYVTARLTKRINGKELIENVTCHWLVGADGARGVTRKLLGLTFLGEALDVEAVVGEVHAQGVDADLWHIWNDQSGRMTMLRPTEHSSIFSFSLRGPGIDCNEVGSDDAKIIDRIKAVSGRNDMALGEVTYKSVYRPHVRLVNKFSEGRVFVAGDAAHVHSPAGGQGMNSSVQDAFNLGWKLTLVEKGVATQSLLSTYNEERLPVIKHMLQETTSIFNRVTNSMTKGRASEGGWERGKELTQLGVNYRWSSIVVDERSELASKAQQTLDVYGLAQGEEVCAGDRAPDAPGLVDVANSDTHPATLFDVFSPIYHTVLVFASAHSQIIPFLETLDQYPKDLVRKVLVYPRDSNASVTTGTDLALKDEAGHAYTGYNIISEAKPTVVVVRPDAVVGAIVFGINGLQRYLRGVFSAC